DPAETGPLYDFRSAFSHPPHFDPRCIRTRSLRCRYPQKRASRVCPHYRRSACTSASAAAYQGIGHIPYCSHIPYGRTLPPHKEEAVSEYRDTYFSDTRYPFSLFSRHHMKMGLGTPYNKAFFHSYISLPDRHYICNICIYTPARDSPANENALFTFPEYPLYLETRLADSDNIIPLYNHRAIQPLAV